jgi:IS30 family transposase
VTLEDAVEAHKAFTALKAQAAAAQDARNAAIIKAHQEGVTAYRIAKALGVAESTIGRIIQRSQHESA